jgi:hypothetical protein
MNKRTAQHGAPLAALGLLLAMGCAADEPTTDEDSAIDDKEANGGEWVEAESFPATCATSIAVEANNILWLTGCDATGTVFYQRDAQICNAQTCSPLRENVVTEGSGIRVRLSGSTGPYAFDSAGRVASQLWSGTQQNPEIMFPLRTWRAGIREGFVDITAPQCIRDLVLTGSEKTYTAHFKTFNTNVTHYNIVATSCSFEGGNNYSTLIHDGRGGWRAMPGAVRDLANFRQFTDDDNFDTVWGRTFDGTLYRVQDQQWLDAPQPPSPTQNLTDHHALTSAGVYQYQDSIGQWSSSPVAPATAPDGTPIVEIAFANKAWVDLNAGNGSAVDGAGRHIFNWTTVGSSRLWGRDAAGRVFYRTFISTIH